MLWGLLLALVLAIIPAGAIALPTSTARVETMLQVCPAIELSVRVQPSAPVVDPDLSNNVYQGRIFVCPH